MAANGAFGIGQWRGARKRALFAKYGHAPTWQQQAAFMLSEIHGGDAGGQSVLEAHSAGGAMVAYLQNFMRPQGAHNEHMQDLINDIRRGRGFLAHNPLAGHSFHINTLQVNTQAKDGKHIARDIHHHLKHHVMVAQADTGGRS